MEIKQLLNKIESIAKQNEELSILRGENFNIFQIFNMESDENKMHSRFINTLLNPKGNHGRGKIFLELFLNILNIPTYFDNLDNVSTKIEHFIGKVKIDEMNSTGGRIDIYIWDSKRSISIENKIYAVDQEKQIVRYYNHQKKTNTVFYLNLFGTESEGDYSKGELKSNQEKKEEIPDFYCISYSKTILYWLGKCQKEVSDFPVIRETIKQYIITVKRLTNQLTNQKMSEEINKLIINNYESAKIIASNIDNAKLHEVDLFLSELEDEVRNKLGENWNIKRDDINNKWSSLKIYHNKWPPNTAISIQGQPYFWKKETVIGLSAPKESEIRHKLESSLNEGNSKEIKTNYPKESKGWSFYRHAFNLGDDTQFSKLLSKEKKIEFIKNLSSEIIKLSEILKKF